TIQGTLTYYFNGNFGSKPDTGARILILQGEQPDLTTDNSAFSRAEGSAFKTTMADGQGSLHVPSLPAGTYCVLIRSSHANSQDHLLGKLLQKTVVLREGETVDVSNDFGMTYIN